MWVREGARVREWLANSLVWAADRLRGKASGAGGSPFAQFLRGGVFGWPGSWGQDRAEQVRHYRHWVYVGIRAIANEVASATARVALVTPTAEDRPASSRSRVLARKALGLRRKFEGHEEITPVRPEHPVARGMADPNDPQTRREFWFAWTVYHKLTGIAYIWARPNGIELDGKKLVKDLWVLPTHWVFPQPGKDQPISHYEIRPYGGIGAGGGLKIPYEDVISFADCNPMFPLGGYSALEAGSEWVDVAESQHTAQWAQNKRGVNPGYHLELPAGVDATDQVLERYYAKLEERLRGENNFHAPLITANGAKLNPLAVLTAQEMAFLESGDQSRDRILALLGVGKGIVGIEPGAAKLSAYAPYLQFCRFTVSPILEGVGEALTERYARRYDDRLRIWYDDPTPNDPEEMRKDIKTRQDTLAISPNEVRAMYGEEPWDPAVFPDGDKPIPLKGSAPAKGNEDGDGAGSRLAASLDQKKR